MSCCGSCAYGRKCKGKKKRKNPNFLYMPNRRRRKNPEASTNFIYEANGKRRTHRMKIRGRKRPSQRYKAHLAAKGRPFRYIKSRARRIGRKSRS